MSQLTDDVLRAMAADIVADVRRHAPEWTGVNESDPGVTILELFAFLTEQLLYRAPVPSHAHPLVNHLIANLTALSGHAAPANGLTRVRYFDGQFLSADDLRAEQDYFREKSRLQNRWLHGAGVVTGLSVTLDPGSAEDAEPVVHVSPGCAIAPDGELLRVETGCVARYLSASASTAFVVLRFVERPIRPVAAVGKQAEPSRIEEGVAIEITAFELPHTVTVARLERGDGRWRVDPTFSTLRPGLHA
jgi:hypothetical protein